MSYTIRAMFPAICLTLILPCSQIAMAADPAPAKDATPAETPVERAALPSRSQEDALALERSVPQAEQQQLQAGDDSFLALWKPAKEGYRPGYLNEAMKKYLKGEFVA